MNPLESVSKTLYMILWVYFHLASSLASEAYLFMLLFPKSLIRTRLKNKDLGTFEIFWTYPKPLLVKILFSRGFSWRSAEPHQWRGGKGLLIWFDMAVGQKRAPQKPFLVQGKIDQSLCSLGLEFCLTQSHLLWSCAPTWLPDSGEVPAWRNSSDGTEGFADAKLEWPGALCEFVEHL